VEHDEDFERFYAAAFGRIAGQLFVVTGDIQAAEDVPQEAFARASSRCSRLRAHDLPEAWVRRVALRLATDRFRRARRRLVALRRLDAEPHVPTVSVEALALAEELQALPLTWRKAIVLHDLVGMPVEEAARTLGCRPGR
jgi:RNA polymerase sigma-70 factor, ECF subfamily